MVKNRNATGVPRRDGHGEKRETKTSNSTGQASEAEKTTDNRSVDPRTIRLSGPTPSDEQRTEFQRDRDRLLYSSPFRRLGGVTQVVAPEEGHIFHNRLTHTLKVAQIGRRMAEMFNERSKELADGYKIHPDVVESACLAHDLGHPPYGHIAEEELDSLMKERQCGDGYEGNAQSFRIVTKLCPRDEKTPGLDLTRATLNAILKYPWLRERDGKGAKKWGAYSSEEAEFHKVREGEKPKVASAEAQVMTWADDIAYAVHDTEDFFRAGLIPLDRLAHPKSLEAEILLKGACERLSQSDDPVDLGELQDALNRISQLFPVSPYGGTRQDRFRLSHQSSGLIRSYVSSTKLRPKPDEHGHILYVDPPLKTEVRLLQQLTWQYVIYNPSLACQQYGQRMVIRTLFNFYADAVNPTKAKHYLLPPMFRSDIEGLHREYGNQRIPDPLLFRVVADTVASMTDTEAHRMYLKITGAVRGSVLDPQMG